MSTPKDFGTTEFPIGTIIAFAGTNTPEGWLPCDGSTISDIYEELITLLGTKTTPPLMGLTLIGIGKAASGSTYTLGQTGGVEMVQLTPEQMPSHTHGYNTYVSEQKQSGSDVSCWSGTNATQTASAGGDEAHPNMQPFYAVKYIIYAGV